MMAAILGMIKNRNAEGIKSVFKILFFGEKSKKICGNQFNLSNLCSKKKPNRELLFQIATKYKKRKTKNI